MYKVTSEIYEETNFNTTKANNGRLLSKFKFDFPATELGETVTPITVTNGITVDKDGDLIVPRRPKTSSPSRESGILLIEHSEATELCLVGLQVWRGALLLADYIFHKRGEFRNKVLLELGAGVGLTSIAAAICCTSAKIFCTDVNRGGILDLIRANVKHNSNLFPKTNTINVLEFDFLKPQQEYAPALVAAIDQCDIVLAADVIYDDALTDAFIHVLHILLECAGKNKTVYIALEKRYVFTLAELDSVAPMFEYFLKQTSHKPWKIEYIAADFPQYFEYDRSKHLVLLKVECDK